MTKNKNDLGKPKPVTKEMAEAFCSKVDMDGLAYAVENYSSDFHDTELEPLIEAAKIAMKRLEAEVGKLREKSQIEVS